MKKKIVLFLLAVVLTVLAAACGEKSQEDVIEDLERNLDDLTGYKAQASMTLQTGEEPQVYDVEVWYKSPSFYRVALNHTEKDQSQIILRNEEGVFVLTPALNKSFRFQSDWPENNSQVYLYESLMNDILMDPERGFTVTDDHYMFQTKTNYTNRNLNQQEVLLHKSDLTPASVKIMDAELSVLVDVAFEDFQLNAEISDSDFDMDRNMTAAQLEAGVPAMTEDDEEPGEGNETGNEEDPAGNEQDGITDEEDETADEKDETAGGAEDPAHEEDGDFTVFYPMYEPQGTSFSHSEEVETDNGRRVVLNYEGDQPFTVIQQRSRFVEASTPIDMTSGEPVDLGFAIGVLSRDGDTKSVSWSYEGTDFFLISEMMDKEELMAVARSVYGTEEK